MNSEYYYYQPGKATSGPLALGSIIAAVNAGELGGDTLVSLDGQTEWQLLVKLRPGAVRPTQSRSVASRNDRLPSTPNDRLPSSSNDRLPTWIESALRITGSYTIVLGGVIVGAGMVATTNGAQYLWVPAFGISGMISGLLLQASSEVLRLLGIIAAKK